MSQRASDGVPPLVASIDIAVPPSAVWALVGDLTAMPRWSPQVVKTLVLGGRGQGSHLVNLNHRGRLVWPTHGRVVRYVPEHELAFRITENWTTWSYRLEPTEDGGTRVVESREAPHGVSPVALRVTDLVLGGVLGFTDELKAGMEQTLARLKAELEAA